MKAKIVKNGLGFALFALSQNCFAENVAKEERNIFVGCSASLAFFGREKSCTSQYALSDYLSLGVRYSNGQTMKNYAHTGLATVTWRPMAGSFYAEGGLGFSRYHSETGLESQTRNGNEIGLNFRLGNRWTLPFGATLGLSYCGIVNSALLLVGPEIGWRF